MTAAARRLFRVRGAKTFTTEDTESTEKDKG
jgi:hypothetical protein